MPPAYSTGKLSFRSQILLLGALVVVLAIAVLFAIVATLRYTNPTLTTGRLSKSG